MNNPIADNLIQDCNYELKKIETLIEVLTSTNPAVPYLTKYALIKACGTIEQSFKTIISDYTCLNQSNHVKSYIDQTFRNSSINPNLNNIQRSLNKFNEDWSKKFDNSLNNDPNCERLKRSIKSLNNARNQFAHGDIPNVTFHDIKLYFADGVKIIGFLENIFQDNET